MSKGSRLRPYLVTGLISLAVVFMILWSRGTFQKSEPAQVYMDLSDAFLVPGAMLAGIGGLLFASGSGIFDMLNFGVMKVFSLIRSDAHRASQPKTFYDYVESKSGTKKGRYGYLLLSGLVLLALAGLFLALYLGQTKEIA